MTSNEDKAHAVGLKIVTLLREYLNEGNIISGGDVSLGYGYYIESAYSDDDERVTSIELVKYEPGKRVVVE